MKKTRKTRTPRKREFDVADLLVLMVQGLDELHRSLDRLYTLYDRRITQLEALCGVAAPKRKRIHTAKDRGIGTIVPPGPGHRGEQNRIQVETRKG